MCSCAVLVVEIGRGCHNGYCIIQFHLPSDWLAWLWSPLVLLLPVVLLPSRRLVQRARTYCLLSQMTLVVPTLVLIGQYAYHTLVTATLGIVENLDSTGVLRPGGKKAKKTIEVVLCYPMYTDVRAIPALTSSHSIPQADRARQHADGAHHTAH